MPLLRHVEERVYRTWEASRRRQSSILSRFVAEAERAGGVVRQAVDPQAVGFSIAALAKAQGITLCQATDRDLARELNLEAALIEAVEGAEVLIHVEPEEEAKRGQHTA